MILSRILRIPGLYRLDKRYLTLIPRTKNILESCYNVIDKNIYYMLHGPTSDEVLKDIDLTGKTCLLTGANSGIGLEMTRCLNAHGCSLLLGCRNVYAAAGVHRHVCDKYDLLHFYETNLASLKSVKQTADQIIKLNKQIDIVILNAAVFGLPWTITEDGLETTFQVNYLSQYYLLSNIEKLLAPDVRVVFISSESHRNISWTLNNILTPSLNILSLPEHEYTSIRAYNVSKLCTILAMQYLGYKWLDTGKQVFCAHPGSFIKTKLCRNWWVYEALYTSMKPFSKSIKQAASTPLFCATSPMLDGQSGLYMRECRSCAPSELAADFQLAMRVMDLTYDALNSRDALRDVETSTTLEAETIREQKELVEEPLVSSCSG